ncbi:MAG TPA: oxidoreductase [Spongiibacteraceae bacterium]|nr:oxidoreductase [Spongiibacteraceae bacterium]HCS27331.1 oxidoreductase [Spongiibacteraceae bacterium]|tara:strand:+ start:273 stop:1028 length:756 start_codon:yes stop_codon:yes gene_type:complete
MNLTGNTILITGGGSGIGQALAIKFAQLNNTVIICGRRQNKLNETVEREPRIKAYCCDVTDPLDVDRLSRQLQADDYQLNILINNAAILNYYNFSKPDEFKLDAATLEINCNLTAPINLSMALLPQLLRHPHPHIINVGSPGGIVAISPSPLYSASKAGLHAFTQVLRLHLKNQARVIEVFPPTVETEMTTNLPRKKVSSEQCVNAILDGLRKGKDEVWVGEGKVVRMLMNLLPPAWVFRLVNSQPSMQVK